MVKVFFQFQLQLKQLRPSQPRWRRMLGELIVHFQQLIAGKNRVQNTLGVVLGCL